MKSLAEKRSATGGSKPFQPPDRPVLAAQALARELSRLGVRHAFGVSGGAIALVFDALIDSPVDLHHFRHESGAAFAAAEASLTTGRPTVVFATTGPGLLNTLTGLAAARWDGAKVLLISGATNPSQRGRWATQETSSYTLSQDALFASGSLFDLAVRIEQAHELMVVLRRLATGFQRPGGFVAHLSLPMSVQSSQVDSPRVRLDSRPMSPNATAEDVAFCARRLAEPSSVIWAGFGATSAALFVRELAERTLSRVLCSPRGKGILPEDHPLYLGVSGESGHPAAREALVQLRPKWTLVLGSRLGQATSGWEPDFTPSEGFVHVDLDPEVPGSAFPAVSTQGIQADIGEFLEDLLTFFPSQPGTKPTSRWPHPPKTAESNRESDAVSPQDLMAAIQRQIVQSSDAPILTEAGPTLGWCNQHLCFPSPGRFRVSNGFRAEGHAACGVVGTALARRDKAVAVVDRASMLVASEVSSAVQYQAPAVWIVLNETPDSRPTPEVDFVRYAQSLGADGARVESEGPLDLVLRRAMTARGPFVIDVHTAPLI